jgi:hypothetical protein
VPAFVQTVDFRVWSSLLQSSAISLACHGLLLNLRHCERRHNGAFHRLASKNKKKTSNPAYHFLFLTSFQVGRCDPHPLLLLLAQLCIADGASPLLPVLAASTVVNSSAAMAKDRAFARLFGAGPARSLPAASYALWVSRDVLSTAAIFSLPPMLAVVMQVRPTSPCGCRFCIYVDPSPLFSGFPLSDVRLPPLSFRTRSK